MPTCRDCGEEIKFIENWRGKWYVCDIDPEPNQKPIYIEIHKNEFITEYRHDCVGYISEKQKRVGG